MKKALILGYGVSGKACEKLLEDEYETYIFEDNINANDQKYLTKEQIINDLPLFDLTIRSPGFSLSHELYPLINLLSKELISEIELGHRYLKNKNIKIIAITGSNGKTTIATLLYELLKEKHQCYLLGNIGTPLTSMVKSIKCHSVVILELSSFQLENIKDFKFDLGIISNITYNHLDQVPSFTYYVASKKRMILNSENSPIIVDDDNYFKEYSHVINYHKNNLIYLKDENLYYQNKKILKKEELKVQSNYIMIDAQIALLAATTLFGFSEDYLKVIKEFKGVKYRQEIINGQNIIFINDGKSTSVDSLNNALELYKTKKRIIIIGGIYKSKGIEESPFKEDDLILIYGRDKEILFKLIKRGRLFDTLDETLNYLLDLDLTNKVVLFSPACSSFDLYPNYIKRSEVFLTFIKEHFYVS